MAHHRGNAIIVGASSGIGAALAHALAADGYRLAILGRRAKELEDVRAGLPSPGSGGSEHRAYQHDVTRYDEIHDLFELIVSELGGVDLVVYAAGVLPKIGREEFDIEKDRSVLEANLVGAVAWLDVVAVKFMKQRSGVICGISSIAGDRGRKPYPAYHAAKAGFTTFLESLRNRLASYGVSVVTIKPGFIDTPMTQGMDKRPFVISAAKAASLIKKHIESRAHTRYVPAIWGWISLAIRSIPSFIFKKMNI